MDEAFIVLHHINAFEEDGKLGIYALKGWKIVDGELANLQRGGDDYFRFLYRGKIVGSEKNSQEL